MPSNERLRVKRRLDQAVNLFEQGNVYIMEEGFKFKDVHDNYFQVFGMITMLVDQVITETKALRDKI